MSRVETIKYQGKEYATVPQRLKEFREKFPKAKIDTSPTYFDDGAVVFKATIIQDQSDEYSASGSGSARYSADEINKPKAFEKLETISVGRALANIGFLNNGQIATTEEMQEFENFKQSKVEQVFESIKTAEKRGDFQEILAKLNPQQKREAAPLIRQRMEELKDATAGK